MQRYRVWVRPGTPHTPPPEWPFAPDLGVSYYDVDARDEEHALVLVGGLLGDGYYDVNVEIHQ